MIMRQYESSIICMCKTVDSTLCSEVLQNPLG